MVELSVERLRTAAADYRDHAPFYDVEADRLETLPTAFAEDSFLWKDVEWVVRWYCRRPLDGRERSPENDFRSNEMATIRDAIATARAAETTREATNALLAMDGVDVTVASAFLQFMTPEAYVVVYAPTWRLLADHGELSATWPDAVTPGDYETFLAACADLAEQADLSLVEVERGLWQCAGVWA